jgi:hypothetical protein
LATNDYKVAVASTNKFYVGPCLQTSKTQPACEITHFLANMTLACPHRRAINLREKREYLVKVKKWLDKGEVFHSICLSLWIDHTQVCRWMEDADAMKGCHGRACTLHPGKPCSIAKWENHLLQWLDTPRANYEAVTADEMILFMSSHDADFAAKSSMAQRQVVNRFLRRRHVSRRRGTRVAQRLPEAAEAEARGWVEMVCPTLEGSDVDLDYVINMDRT